MSDRRQRTFEGVVELLCYRATCYPDPLDAIPWTLRFVVHESTLGLTAQEWVKAIDRELASGAAIRPRTTGEHSEETLRRYLIELRARILAERNGDV